MKFPEIIILRDKYRLGCCRVDPGAAPHPTSSPPAPQDGSQIGSGTRDESNRDFLSGAAQAAKIRSVIAGHLFRLPATKTPEMCDDSDCSHLGNSKSDVMNGLLFTCTYLRGADGKDYSGGVGCVFPRHSMCNGEPGCVVVFTIQWAEA